MTSAAQRRLKIARHFSAGWVRKKDAPNPQDGTKLAVKYVKPISQQSSPVPHYIRFHNLASHAGALVTNRWLTFKASKPQHKITIQPTMMKPE